MLASATIVVPISRGYEDAYALLSDPSNYPRWSPVAHALFLPVGNDGLDWLVDLPRGRRVLRFSPRNDFGVLDYTVLLEDGTIELITPTRLVPKGDGCELVSIYQQHPGVSDEKFKSDVEWARADLNSIKLVIEAL